MSTLVDAGRLAVGTLSVLPVRPPRRVDGAVGGVAMLLAPAVGLVLAALVAVPAGVLTGPLERPPLLVAVLVVGALAFLTRAMHADGLADVADGLGSGRTGEEALAVMKRSDIGPFGVVTLLVALLAQVAATAVLLAADPLLGAAALGVAVVLGRTTLPWLCTPAYPAARPGGLGALVAGRVERPAAAVAVALVVALLAVGAWSVTAGHDDRSRWLVAAGLGLVVGQGCARGLASRCVRRFGGVTGDVYGAAVETAVTATLVATALVAA
ncbi:adenosylcobinamide-GDP ribazoletransferase [Nocardioides sp. ChNu-153]|uniref:adenosylcobinamide-GDP ribazoletransferase n=1 Tax=Nocardioides sp. ChNu-153 TaxID=2779364 RepID=UPI00264B3598|nr:adenosylcobinamide-GDP ribazoletransferase [Nocardioides sp. ChNu-153]MDN7121689.1 adenosylcobinamide-GDP ribazoletransferase [Nocardioides sp. ChNu-153]